MRSEEASVNSGIGRGQMFFKRPVMNLSKISTPKLTINLSNPSNPESSSNTNSGLFGQLYKKNSTVSGNAGQDESIPQVGNGTKRLQSSFADVIARHDDQIGGNGIPRTMSVITNLDSPVEALRNAKVKEALRERFYQETLPIALRYSSLDGTQLQIEGPYHLQDYSFSLVSSCKEIKRVE